MAPFGALSLKSPVPFSVDGSALGFYIRGSADTSAAALGSLEMQVGGWRRTEGGTGPSNVGHQVCFIAVQLESATPSRYAVTPALSLSLLLQAQAAADGGSGEQLLADVAGGAWVPVKIPLSQFLPTSAQQRGGSFKADRITLGSCLQVCVQLHHSAAAKNVATP